MYRGVRLVLVEAACGTFRWALYALNNPSIAWLTVSSTFTSVMPKLR